CSDETCVTITWSAYDRCMTCGTGDCGSWDIGNIFFSHPDVNTRKSFANIAVDTCVCTGPLYEGEITWCFGNLDCETLVATIVGWDSAGNMSEPLGMEIGNTDTVPPTITQFEISELMFEGDIPYVELTWEATDNCFDFVNIWVNQGSFQKPMLDVIETAAISFVPPEPWTAFQKSKSWVKTVKWYLEDPAEEMKAWIAAYDICCNEATDTVSREGFEFNLDVYWEGEGWAGDGGEGISYGTVVTLTADPTPCWSFVEWQITDRTDYSTSSENPLEYTVTGDASVVAIFEENYYDLSVSASPSDLYGHVLLVDPSGGKCGEVATATAGEVECYEFEGWYDSEDNLLDDGWTYTFTIEEDLDLVAWYTMIQYELSLSASPTNGGTVTGAGTYDCCDEVSITAEATNDCWEFLGWYLVSDQHGEPWETEAATDFDLCDDLELVAWFAEKSFTITYVASPSQSGGIAISDNGNIGSIILPTGQASTTRTYPCSYIDELGLIAIFDADLWAFSKWIVEDEGGAIESFVNPMPIVQITSDATITAVFDSIGG
ncbi:InlB B-repeat-containing protein, partial [Mesotoga sp. HF07.pep.5.2.highcov]|uniref:InlB B-repeat-containing protein n=1 Tax=Mesotoga sp. HF07.pep.5.2.highcov TaxID=1462923 RepID=UPI0011C4824B